jgi:hypothetical protein
MAARNFRPPLPITIRMRQETRKARCWTPKPAQWLGERETLAGTRHAFLASAGEARRYAEEMQQVGVEVQLHRVH